eukprot:363616-Chlamydomonas_euryale.AAC.3
MAGGMSGLHNSPAIIDADAPRHPQLQAPTIFLKRCSAHASFVHGQPTARPGVYHSGGTQIARWRCISDESAYLQEGHRRRCASR